MCCPTTIDDMTERNVSRRQAEIELTTTAANGRIHVY